MGLDITCWISHDLYNVHDITLHYPYRLLMPTSYLVVPHGNVPRPSCSKAYLSIVTVPSSVSILFTSSTMSLPAPRVPYTFDQMYS